jgi:dienelactone hydrolase
VTPRSAPNVPTWPNGKPGAGSALAVIRFWQGRVLGAVETRDPFFTEEGDIDAARALVQRAKDAELFLYPGDQHLFADSSLPSYDAGAAALLTERVLRFLCTR